MKNRLSISDSEYIQEKILGVFLLVVGYSLFVMFVLLMLLLGLRCVGIVLIDIRYGLEYLYE